MNVRDNEVAKKVDSSDSSESLALELKKALRILHNSRHQICFAAFTGGLGGGALVVLLYVLVQLLQSAAS